MLEAQDCNPQQSAETAQDYNHSPEAAQYSTLYFISRDELPQAKCNSLKTVQVSRIRANEKSEHIQPAWIAQSQNSKVHQMDIEIDTGAGCNVMLLYKVNELFGQEWLVQRLSPPTVRIKAYGDQEVKVIGSIVLYMYTNEKTDSLELFGKSQTQPDSQY